MTSSTMDFDEMFGPALKKGRTGSQPVKKETKESHVRALLIVVDCEAMTSGNIEMSRQVQMDAANVIFVSSQERATDGSWGLSTVTLFADPVTNLCAKDSSTAFLTSLAQASPRGGMTVTGQVYYHSGAPTVPASVIVGNIREMVRQVAPLAGVVCVVGAAVTGPGYASEDDRAALRVTLLKGAAQLYKNDAKRVKAAGWFGPLFCKIRGTFVEQIAIPSLGTAAIWRWQRIQGSHLRERCLSRREPWCPLSAPTQT